MWHVWLIVAGICLLAEIMTTGFLFFWFALGALITLLASFLFDNLIVQFIIFILSSTALLFLTKPLVKNFTRKLDDANTNAFSIIEKVGIVTEDIDSVKGSGLIKINGEVWSAIGLNNTNISKGTEIKVVEIKGVKAVVAPTNVSSMSK